METTGRDQDPSVIEQIANEPYRFSFFQLVRVLGHVLELGRIGERPADQRRLKLRSRVSLAFPASSISDAQLERDVGGRISAATLVCDMLGLAGHHGPLPDHYTELILQFERQKRPAFREFLDLFNHRLLELFYRAWEKPRFFVRYERERRDPVESGIGALIGIGTERARAALPFAPEFAACFGGALGRSPVSVDAAEILLSSWFDGVKIRIGQFQGDWVVLDEDSRWRLKSRGEGGPLGRFCPLGSRVWDVQGKVLVRLGPLKWNEFLEFGEGGAKLRELQEVFRYITASSLEMDTELILSETEGWRLGGGARTPFRLGETAFLGRTTQTRGEPVDEKEGASSRTARGSRSVLRRVRGSPLPA